MSVLSIAQKQVESAEAEELRKMCVNSKGSIDSSNHSLYKNDMEDSTYAGIDDELIANLQ